MDRSRIDVFRKAWRQQYVGRHYNGYAHLFLVSLVTLGVIATALAWLDQPSWRDWLAVPLTWLYANVVEYVGHRWPMHRPTWPLRLLYRGHAGQHHRFFRHDSMAVSDHRDFKAVLFPPYLMIFFLGGFGGTAWFLVAAAAGQNAANLFLATILAFFLNYEWFHLLYHLPESNPLLRVPVLRALRRLHAIHHDPRLMARYNFNISYPLLDRLLGTWRNEAGDAEGPASRRQRRDGAVLPAAARRGRSA